MEENNINMDMINFFNEDKSFAIDKNDVEVVEAILKKYKVNYYINDNCAKVTLIGSKVTETPGVIAKIVRGLSNVGIALIQSSDSYTAISCLVREEDMAKTVHVIHSEFHK